MAIDLVEGANEENAGYYAGLMSSAFMVGRALTLNHWAKASSVYGRTTILFASLNLSMAFSIFFGLSSTNFAWAILMRFCL
jgi:MFS family permease